MRPERIGGPDRANLLRSIENLIVKDVATIAADLTDVCVDPTEAACRIGWLWREQVDDAACRGLSHVLIGDEGGAQ